MLLQTDEAYSYLGPQIIYIYTDQKLADIVWATKIVLPSIRDYKY